MALSPDEKFIYVNPDTTSGEYNTAQYFPVKYLRGLECAVATNFYIYFRGPKDAKSTRITVNITSGFIKDFFTQFVDEVNFGENAVITLADRNIATDATTGGTDFQHVNAFVVPVILSDVTTSGHEDVQVAEDLDVAGTITGNLTGDVTGTASVATTVTVADESTDTSCFPLFSTAATGNLEPKSGSNLTFNSSSGLLTATSLAGTLTTAAQTNITSLGTLTALDVDDINLNGKTITITGDTDDTFSIVAGANGATTLTTVDTASNTANFEIAADGNITLDADGDIALEAGGNDITMDSDTLTIESSNSLSPFVTIKSTGNNAFAGYLSFSKQRADDSPADSDAVGSVLFAGEDAAGASQIYGSLACSIVEADNADEAGKIQIKVANDGTERNGITMSGDKGTASEVDVTIANGAASVTTIAGTLTMGSTAAITNAGLVAVANQSNITGVGTISSGVWEGTAIASANLDADTAHLTTDQTFTGIKQIDRRKFPISSGTDGNAIGDVVYFGGTTSMNVGRIYHYKSDGTWETADADAVATSDGLLGVALGAASDTNGMLLRGMVTLDHDPGAVGDVLFLSTVAGIATATAPSGNNDIVRVIGYCLNASNGQIWFNPDSTFVEVTA